MKKTVVVLLIMFISTLFSAYSRAEEFGSVDIHGFISQGYLKTDKNNYLADTEDGSFQFNELGINFTTDVTDNLRIGLQLFARDLGEDGNDELVLDWALADYHWQDWLGVRVGRLKIGHGLFNETRDMDMLRTSILLPQAIYSELWRDSFSTAKGLALYGDILLGSLGRLSYLLMYGRPNFSKDTGIAAAFEDALEDLGLEVTSLDSDAAPSLALEWNTPIEGLRSKVYLFEIPNVITQGTLSSPAATLLGFTSFDYEADVDGYTLSLEYTLGDLVLASEFQRNYLDPKWDLGLGFEETRAVAGEGWYISATYRFTELFELGLRYAENIENNHNRNGEAVWDSSKNYNISLLLADTQIMDNDFEAWNKATTLSTRFDINENWLIKFEVAFNDGFGGYTSADNTDSNGNKDVDQHWVLYAIKMTYNF